MGSKSVSFVKIESQIEQIGKQVDELSHEQESRLQRLSDEMSMVLAYLERLSYKGPGRAASDAPPPDSVAAHIPPSSSVSLMSAGKERRVRRPSVSIAPPDSVLRQVNKAPAKVVVRFEPEPEGKLEPDPFADMTADGLQDEELCASSSDQPATTVQDARCQLSDANEYSESVDLSAAAPETSQAEPSFRNSVKNFIFAALSLGREDGPGLVGGTVPLKRSNRVRTHLQKMVWSFLEDPDLVRGGRSFERCFSLFILISFFLNVSQMIKELPLNDDGVELGEVILDCLFLIEVLVRLWSSPHRIRFFFRAYNNLDIIAGVLPLALRMGQGSLVLSATSESMSKPMMLLVCMVPILRLLKLLRHFETFHLLIMAFTDALQALPVLLYMLGVLVVFFAAIIFVFENGASVESFPEAVWFILVTISTVGYGDTVPSSLEGHIIVSVLIIISALYMAIPIGIVGKLFGNVWDNRKQLLLLHRLRVRFITAGYNVDDIPAMFCNFDANADGQLSKTEFRDMLRQMEIELSQGVAADIFSAFDEDGSGAVDDVEFVKALFPKTAAMIYDSPLDKAEDEENEEEDEAELSSWKGDQSPED
eukprot:TRINITY_DN72290_c0_g1_i1.p1 TRINITY_DN72290_c0_g1~~TRINITY_DN72290_c0_g1_i1.p1  ORF type:complete len:637 (-),score=132.56 TRINITY_DN72290_c0_g1_i1:268-2046(-)